MLNSRSFPYIDLATHDTGVMGDIIPNPNGKSMQIILNISTLQTSVTVELRGIGAGGEEYTISTNTVTATGIFVVAIGPDIGAADTATYKTIKRLVPPRVRILTTVGAVGNIYSVSYDLIGF